VVGCLRAWEEGEREGRREEGRKRRREREVEEVERRLRLSQHSNRRIALNWEVMVRGRRREWKRERRRVEMPGQVKRASTWPIASVLRDFRSRYCLDTRATAATQLQQLPSLHSCLTHALHSLYSCFTDAVYRCC